MAQTAPNAAPQLELNKANVRQRVLALAGPAVAEMFLVSLVGMVSMMMVGRISPVAVATVGLTNQPLFLGLAIFQALNVGATALVARCIGAGDIQKANDAARQSLIFVIVVGIIISALGWIFARQLLQFMGAEPEVLATGIPYFRVIAVSLIFNALSMGVSAILRGAGDTKTPMRVNIIANIVNAVATWILIYGIGFPGLGVLGAGFGSALSRLAACILSFAALFSGKQVIRISLKDNWRLDWDLMARIWKIGLPAAIEQFVMRGGMMTFIKVVSSLGTVTYAAHQIALNIISLSFTPGQGFAIAATTLVGQNLGAKQPDWAEHCGWETRRLGNYVAGFMGIVFFFFGKYLAMLYSNDPEVIANVAMALKIIAIVQPLQSTQFILAGGLRGAGDTKWPLYSTAFGVWGVRVVLAHILVNIVGMGLIGAWIAMAVDQFFRSTVVLLRYRSGKWKTARV